METFYKRNHLWQLAGGQEYFADVYTEATYKAAMLGFGGHC